MPDAVAQTPIAIVQRLVAVVQRPNGDSPAGAHAFYKQTQMSNQYVQPSGLERPSGGVSPQAEEECLDRMLAIARKKKELLLMQQELQRPAERPLDLAVLNAMVSRFSGVEAQDILKWTGELEGVFNMFGWGERDKLVAARHLLEGHARRFAEIVAARSYNELRQALFEEFKRSYTLQDVFRQLKARTLRPNEAPKQYIVEMQFIASRADVAEAELIDIIIDGLNDKTPQVSMLCGAKTLRELKILTERYEKRRRAPASHAVLPRSVVPRAPTSTTTASAQSNAVEQSLCNVRCYHCFRYGHFQSACPAPKRPPNACFICSEVGHSRHECPKRGKPAITHATAAAILGEDDDAELNYLSRQLAANNLVSVTFFNRDKCTGLTTCSALFDTGSPVSFVRRSLVPFLLKRSVKSTPYWGMDRKQLGPYGLAKMKLVFKGQN